MSCALLAALRRVPRACLLAIALCVLVAQALATAHLATAHLASAHPGAWAGMAAQSDGRPGVPGDSGLGTHGTHSTCGQCLHALAFAGMAPGAAVHVPVLRPAPTARAVLQLASPSSPQSVSPFMGRAPPRFALV
jgi:hypothetical protein